MFYLLLILAFGFIIAGTASVRYYSSNEFFAFLPNYSEVPLWPWLVLAAGFVLLLFLLRSINDGFK